MQHESIRSTNTTTLEDVQEHFQQWRREKPAHNSHIPDYLWDQVPHIDEDYRQSDILKHLKITRYQLVAAMKSRQNHQDMGSTASSNSQEIPEYWRQIKRPTEKALEYSADTGIFDAAPPSFPSFADNSMKANLGAP